MALQLDSNNFEQEVIKFDGVVLVDFYADWCPPCKMLAPVIDQLAEDYTSDDKVKVAKLNTEQAPDIAIKYGIQGIPNVIVFKNGTPAGQQVGFGPKEVYVNLIESNK
jgi:thioredoxin 1